MKHIYIYFLPKKWRCSFPIDIRSVHFKCSFPIDIGSEQELKISDIIKKIYQINIICNDIPGIPGTLRVRGFYLYNRAYHQTKLNQN